MTLGLTGLPALLASCHLLLPLDPFLTALFQASLLCAFGLAVRHLCWPSSLPLLARPLLVLLPALLPAILPCPSPAFLTLVYVLHETLSAIIAPLPLVRASFTKGEAAILLQALALTYADILSLTLARAGTELFPYRVTDGSSGNGWLERVGVARLYASAEVEARQPVFLVVEAGLLTVVTAGAVVVPLFCPALLTPAGPGGGGSEDTTRMEKGGETAKDGKEGRAAGRKGSLKGLEGGGKPVAGTGTAPGSQGVAPVPALPPSLPPSLSTALPTLAFLSLFAAILLLLLFPWLTFLLPSHPHPLRWLLTFLLSKPSYLPLLALWSLTLLAFTSAIVPLSRAFSLPRILTRKAFHALATSLFALPALHQPLFLSLAHALALSLLLLLEYLRLGRASLLLGRPVHRYYQHFLDDRDMGPLVVTHLYLLLACAFPLWLSFLLPPNRPPSLPLAGILVVGMGDAAAATVGTLCGKHRWPWTRRTLEGSAAFFIATGLGVFTQLGQEGGKERGVWGWVGAVVLLTLLEAFTAQIDNLVLPVYAVALFNVAWHVATGSRG
ncbi:dolichol kinase [Nannochloropsis gaditana]|uniref:dolichol kinase n=1 Tax=Nannochloropsis gaditana TaxID=72520 RepID=W7TAW7_9STRA|nr:dolichol kinase [Nannochloropsis gaditana]